MDIGEYVGLFPSQYVAYIMVVFGTCAVLDAWLPATSSQNKWFWLRKLISVLGQNYRHATNQGAADDKKNS